MSELKACPFCGNVYGDGGIVKDDIGWHCGRCGASISKENGLKIYDEKADEHFPLTWNTRPIEDALQSELTDLRKRIKEAVAEIDADFENPDLQGSFGEGMERVYFIFKKHGLIEEE